MGMEAVRIAFLHAAEGKLRLDHLGMAHQDNTPVLVVTGWHADGAPFAMTTAPFTGNPQVRARQAARDIVAAHGGSQEPVQIESLRRQVHMSQKGSGLARLMGGLKNLDESADALATRLEAAMSGLHDEMATTTAVIGNVEKSVNDLKSVNALYSNGGAAVGNSSTNSGS